MVIEGEQLLGVFADYNLQIWPMQILAYALGLLGLYLGFRKSSASARVIPVILAFFWLWVGFMFWLPSARQGFTIGYLFMAMFAMEGVLFLTHVFKPQLEFGTDNKAYKVLGSTFMLYALIGYPLVGMMIGHVYPRTPPFGLTPCPLIVYTFGMLLLTQGKAPKLFSIIPFFYSLSGVMWISIGIWEDIGMVLSGLVSVFIIWRRDWNDKGVSPEPLGQPQQGTWSLDPGESEDIKKGPGNDFLG